MADPTRFDLRPTLIIGLGGTGHDVLVRLKARYLDAYGEDIFQIIKLLSFDTADEAKDARRENGALVQLDRSTELLNVGNVPTNRILANLDLQPTIKAWLPPDMPVRAITAGAQQVRPMGRLAFFHHFRGTIQPRIEQAIRQLSNIGLRGRDIGEAASIARTQGINVFLITSVCGGTGSGMFIDMAYLIRELCMRQGMDENFCNVNGVLVLPQAFATVPSDAIRANAYAALLELDHFTEGGNFDVEYPGGIQAKIHHRPFNICYLVDAVNERGQMLAGMPQLAPMMAEAIFLQTASQVGDAQKSVFDNVKSLDNTDQGHPTSYSGFGTASLVFPVEVLVDACASRYCADLLSRELVNRPLVSGVVAEQLNGVIEQMRLTEDALRLEMGRDERGRTMRIQLDPKSLEKVPDSEIVRTAISRVQQEEDRNLNDLYQRNIQANHDRLKGELNAILQVELNRIVDQPTLGLDVAIAFLEQLDKHLSTLMTSSAEHRDTQEQRARQGDLQSAKVQEDLVQAASALRLVRGRRVATARDNYINHHRNRLAALLNRNLLSLSLSLMAYLSNDVVRARLKELRTLHDKLSVARDRLRTMATDLSDGKSRALSPLTYEITDASDVQRYYNDYARDLTRELPRLFEEQGPLHDWASRSYEEIQETLLQFGRSVFRGIRDEHIEQVIMDKRDEETPEVRLQQLREDAIPFWNRDTVRMTDGGVHMETISVIGVPDSDSTNFKQVREGEMLASTHNNHTVTVLTTRHGLTVYALQQYDDYRRRYERHRERQISPIHCFDVLNTRLTKSYFAVGQAFDIIKQEGTRFFIVFPAEHQSLQQRVELGQGLEKALTAFLSVADHGNRVRKQIEERSKAIGASEARILIENYLNLPYSRSSHLQEIEKDLKQLALEYKADYFG